jgi:hypothetical protein
MRLIDRVPVEVLPVPAERSVTDMARIGTFAPADPGGPEHAREALRPVRSDAA